MWLNFGKFGDFLIVTDQDTANQLRLTRGAAKALCRFLMAELNCVSAILRRPDEKTGELIDEDLFKVDGALKEYRDKNN